MPSLNSNSNIKSSKVLYGSKGVCRSHVKSELKLENNISKENSKFVFHPLEFRSTVAALEVHTRSSVHLDLQSAKLL